MAMLAAAGTGSTELFFHSVSGTSEYRTALICQDEVARIVPRSGSLDV
jgi:hypothetical protein